MCRFSSACDCECECEREREAVYFALYTFQLLTKLFLVEESVFSFSSLSLSLSVSRSQNEKRYALNSARFGCAFNGFYNMNGKHLFSRT